MSEATSPPFDHRTHEEGVQSDDINSAPIVVVGLISTALVLASALGVQALYESYAAYQRQEKVYSQPFSLAKDALNEQMNQLTGYRAPMGERTAYSIPIQRAMALVVEDIRAQQSKDDIRAQPSTGSARTPE